MKRYPGMYICIYCLLVLGCLTGRDLSGELSWSCSERYPGTYIRYFVWVSGRLTGRDLSGELSWSCSGRYPDTFYSHARSDAALCMTSQEN